MNDITIIIGPTAVGKSDYAISLAQRTNAEIISSDAFQVYKHMDIGTAKVTSDEQCGVTHHLIDIKTPDDGYNVAEFLERCDGAIADIRSRNKSIIICGGTGYYAYAFAYQFKFNEGVGSDPDVKAALQTELDHHGPVPLFERYAAIDPDGAAHIDPNNGARLIRALEIHTVSGQLPSRVKPRPNRRNDVKIMGLEMEREHIIQRINTRVDKMFSSGLVEEVETIIGLGYPTNCPAFKAIGYSEVTQLLEGKLPLGECREQIKVRTRQFSKRQMTWFRKFENTEWIRLSK
jgi:tRNA dimethylallyltransferase